MLQFVTVAVVAMLLSACFSTGRSFSDVATSEQSPSKSEPGTGNKPSSKPWTTPGPSTSPVPSLKPRVLLYIETTPPGASIIADNQRGQSPCTIMVDPYSKVTVEASKPGYRDQYKIMYVGKTEERIHLVLDPILGTLQLLNVLKGSKIYLDGALQNLADVSQQIATSHDLLIRHFEHGSFSARFNIHEQATTTIAVNYQREPFAFSGWRRSSYRMNPDIPALHLTLPFEINGPGNWQWAIRDAAGQIVYQAPQMQASDYSLELAWDGLDSAGTPVPDGTYTIVISGENTGKEVDRKELSLLVSRKLPAAFYGVYSGNAGLVFAHTAETLLAADVQLSLNSSMHIEDYLFRAPTLVSARIGLSDQLELLPMAGITFREKSNFQSYLIGIGLKQQLFDSRDPLYRSLLSVNLRGIWRWQENGAWATGDDRSTFSGLNMGLLFQQEFQPFLLMLNGELQLAPVPYLHSGQEHQVAGAYWWSYLRAGIAYRSEVVMAGISSTLRTGVFGSDSAWLNNLILMSAEFQVRPARTNLQLGASLDAYIKDSRDFFTSFGLGVVISPQP